MNDHALKEYLETDPLDLTDDEIRIVFKLAKKEIKDAYQTSGIALVGMLMLVVAFVVVCD